MRPMISQRGAAWHVSLSHGCTMQKWLNGSGSSSEWRLGHPRYILLDEGPELPVPYDKVDEWGKCSPL